MEQEQTTVKPAAPKETSTISKLMNIFVAPGEVFESIKAAPKKSGLWAIPCLLAIVISIIFVFVVFSDPAIQSQMREMTEKQVESRIAQQNLSPEQAEAARQQASSMMGGTMLKIFGIIGSIVYTIGTLLLVSLVLVLVSKIAFKTPVIYGKALEIVGPSLMTNFVLGSIVSMLTILAMGSIHATPGLGLAISQFDPENKVHVLLSSVNIFTIWYLAVLSIGLGKLASVKTGKAAIWIFGIWVVWTLLTTFVLTFLRFG
jgi:hypothetical protein